MTDTRITATIESMYETSARLKGHSHTRTAFTLGQRCVELVTRPHDSATGIGLDKAFTCKTSTMDIDFRLTVIDDQDTHHHPDIDWPMEWFEPFGVLRPELSGPYRFALDIHSKSLGVYDPRTREAVVWFHDIERIPYWFAATPFRLQLSWFADSFDGEMIHAAGIEVERGVALLVGPGGAGKSTLTLSAMVHGSRTLGDDFLLIENRHAYPIYRRTKFHDSTLNLFGDAASPIGPVLNADNPGEKRIMNIDDDLLCTSGLPVTAVFVPRIGTRAHVSRLSEPQAVRSALGPTMMGLLGGSRDTLHRIVNLIRSVPTFEIEVGPDMADNAKALITAAGDVSARVPSDGSGDHR